MAVSMRPSSFQPGGPGRNTDSDPISSAQAAYLKAKGIEEGISDGFDEHWIENWLFDEWGFSVGDVEDLTRGQFREVLEDMGWGE
jgi:hypothetical protein